MLDTIAENIASQSTSQGWFGRGVASSFAQPDGSFPSRQFGTFHRGRRRRRRVYVEGVRVVGVLRACAYQARAVYVILRFAQTHCITCQQREHGSAGCGLGFMKPLLGWLATALEIACRMAASRCRFRCFCASRRQACVLDTRDHRRGSRRCGVQYACVSLVARVNFVRAACIFPLDCVCVCVSVCGMCVVMSAVSLSRMNIVWYSTKT